MSELVTDVIRYELDWQWMKEIDDGEYIKFDDLKCHIDALTRKHEALMGLSISKQMAVQLVKEAREEERAKNEAELKAQRDEIAYLDAKINSAMCCHPHAVQTLLSEAKDRTHLEQYSSKE